LYQGTALAVPHLTQINAALAAEGHVTQTHIYHGKRRQAKKQKGGSMAALSHNYKSK
jgi:hypothetical protein